MKKSMLASLVLVLGLVMAMFVAFNYETKTFEEEIVEWHVVEEHGEGNWEIEILDSTDDEHIRYVSYLDGKAKYIGSMNRDYYTSLYAKNN